MNIMLSQIIIVHGQIATNLLSYYKHQVNLSPLNFVDI